MIPHIMIVDSDSGSAQTTDAMVRHVAPQAITILVATAEQGLHSLQQRLPDMLIIDPSPVLVADVRLIVAVKAARTGVGVLVIISRSRPVVRRQLEALGINGYLEKPVQPDLLAAHILATVTTALAAAAITPPRID